MKRTLPLLICTVLLLGLLPTTVSAAPTAVAYDDGTIYVGGIYDMWAQITEGADRATYQWQVSVGGDDYYGSGAWYDINDLVGDYGYKGTQTSHLQIVGKPNDDSVAIGSGWENMKFRCKITLDGKDYFTNSLSELRHNTTMLNAVIKAGNYKLYEPKVTGADTLSGSGSSYTAKSAAGQALTFRISCKDVSDTRLVASEFRCIPEIWITDGDTTVHAANELTYTPTKANSQLTVEFKLRMQIGVNNLGYTETKTLQLSTYLPSGIGSGTAKNRTLIYTTASTSSKRLATVATGGIVTIIEKLNESWYKVAYKDHVGYAQASDLSAVTTQTVNEVKAYLPTPAVGKNPRFDATYATTGIQLYKTDPVSWYDETAKRFLTAADTFQSGHDYTLSIRVAAADDYRFRVNGGNIQVTGYVNDSVVSVCNVNSEPAEKVIQLYWTYTPTEAAHSCSLTPIAQKDPDCTNPGKMAYYQCSSCGDCYCDAQGKDKIASITAWGTLPATGHTPSAWRTTGIYHYKVCTVCGDMLESEDHKGGVATCSAKGSCTVCGYAYLEENENHSPDTSKWIAKGSMYHFHACKLCGAHCDTEDHRWSPTYLYQDATGHAWICADCKATSQVEPHDPGPAATETTPQTCKDCNYIIAPAKNHTHKLTKVAQTPATCTEEGNIEHYTCDGCSERFTDPEAKNKIPNALYLQVGALGHTTSENWSSDGQYHWRTCDRCGVVLDETKMLHDSGEVCATCGHKADASAPTAEPTQTAPNATESTKPTKSNRNKTGSQRSETAETDWGCMILVGAVTFAAALTATVIILKKQKSKK